MARSLHGNAIFSLLLMVLFCTLTFIYLSPIESSSLIEKKVHDANSSEVNFSGAGSNEILITGQPIHLGDQAQASILIHNEGEITDSVRLMITGFNNTVWIGDFVEIDPGSSRAIFVTFEPQNIGNNEFHWSVNSTNGGIDANLNGSFDIEVRDMQSLQLLSFSYSWTFEEGLEIFPAFYLSEGVSRDILINVFDNADKSNLLQSLEVSLDHGSRVIPFDLSNPHTDNIFLEVIPMSWNLNTTDSKVTSSISVTPPYTSVDVTINNFYPKNPALNENISFEYTISNDGNVKINSALIRIIMSDQTILHEENSPSLLAGTTYSGKIIIDEWKYAYSTNLSIYFISGEYSNDYWTIIESSNSPSISTLPFDIYAVIYGSIAGLSIVIVGKIVISAISNRTPSTFNNSKLRPPRESRSGLKNNDKLQNKEVCCPLCEQRLNVPLSHEGRVKCPSCDSTFEVQSFKKNSQDIDPREIEPEYDESIKILSSSSSGDMLNCPSCEQKLRVLESKRPVRARCPACRCEFMALSEEK